MSKPQNPRYVVLSGTKLNGETKISSATLEVIASIAAKEVDGVVDLQAQTKERFSGFFFSKRFKQTKGVVLRQNDEGQPVFTIYAILSYGVNIPKTALAIQNAVRSAISAATDLQVADVDLVVSGLINADHNDSNIDPNNLFDEKAKK
ncbi:Asp23/Gls24 family envelope stress response protein [Oenococcus alcoholitolerans]|uniref:Asp23/Gls24 family envelope stress response protein n=1 Tax=Oenococcus alcoholitolerans TaxID=931074 RepID=UPI003F6E7E12